MDGITSLVWGATGLILAVYIALIAAGIIGAICSIIGLVRGITNHNTTAIAVGGVGVGCAVLGIFVLPIVFWIACFVCGTMACQLSKQQHVLSYEEFKRQKAMMQDPEYAEYMRDVHGVENTSGMTLEQKFDRKAAANPILGLSEAQFARLSLKAKHGILSSAEQQTYNDYVQASAQKHGGKVKPPMSDGKLGAIVLAIIAVCILAYFAINSAVENGMFDHLEGASVVEQQASTSDYIYEVEEWRTTDDGTPRLVVKYQAKDAEGNPFGPVYDTPEEVPEPDWHKSLNTQTESGGNGKQTIEDLGNGTILFLPECK